MCKEGLQKPETTFNSTTTADNKITLVANNKYCSSNDQQQAIVCDKPTGGNEERFEKFQQKDGKIALKCYNAKYLTLVASDLTLKCTATEVDKDEEFMITELRAN